MRNLARVAYKARTEVKLGTVGHTLGLARISSEILRGGGGKDILGLEDLGYQFPINFADGTELIPEVGMHSSFKRYRDDRSMGELRETTKKASESPNAPEMERGNEYHFVVFGRQTNAKTTGVHVPDLVLAVPRAHDGAVRHIAIELELTLKSKPAQMAIFRDYQSRSFMFSNVIYFVKDAGPAATLRAWAEEAWREVSNSESYGTDFREPPVVLFRKYVERPKLRR